MYVFIRARILGTSNCYHKRPFSQRPLQPGAAEVEFAPRDGTVETPTTQSRPFAAILQPSLCSACRKTQGRYDV